MNKIFSRRAYTSISDSGMFFLCFVIIASGIVFGVYLFYTTQEDISLTQAFIINEKISRVFISEEGFNNNILEENFDIIGASGLDKKFFVNGQAYISIEIFKDNLIFKKIEAGNTDFSVLCGLHGEQLARCLTTKLIIEDYLIKIKSSVGEKGNQ